MAPGPAFVPISNVIGQLDPADRARGVYEKFGGTRDILAVFAGLGVHNAVSANDFCIRIGEKREAWPSLCLGEITRPQSKSLPC